MAYAQQGQGFLSEIAKSSKNRNYLKTLWFGFVVFFFDCYPLQSLQGLILKIDIFFF